MENMQPSARREYQKLIQSNTYLVFLIAYTVAIALQIVFNGNIIFALGQIFSLLMLIGLYMAKSGSVGGVKLVRVTAAICFWLYAIIGGVASVIIIRSALSMGQSSSDTGFAVFLIGIATIFCLFGISAIYYRDINKICRDVELWFTPAPSELPRDRYNCRLPVICVLLIIVNGLLAFAQMASLSSRGLGRFAVGMFLDDVLEGSGSQLASILMPGTSPLQVIASAGTVAKYVCILMLYRSYSVVAFKQNEPIPNLTPVPTPAPSPEPPPAPLPPQPKKERSVEIIMRRISPQSGTFSRRMTKSMTVGRNANVVDLAITDDKSISSSHCKLFIHNNKLFCRDNKSFNGTFLNGKKIEGDVQVHKGDTLGLGNSKFTIDWRV